MLAAKDLAKSFGGVAAVAGVSFSVARGEVVALIGPNGAGKSTCFNLLNGQLRPDRGQVRLDDRAITGLGPRALFRRGVSRTFQITETFASLTVRENVKVVMRSAAARTWRLRAADDAGAADALLDRLGMLPQADRAGGVLAYGDLKRLELALALANRPSLLLMDEPTAGMARDERNALLTLVRGLSRTDGVAVLFTEHDMEAVFATADRVLVMDQGRIIAEGPPEAVRQDARVRAAYLGTDAPT